jgi:hypothetical protein
MTGFAADLAASVSIRAPKLPSRFDAPTSAKDRASSMASNAGLSAS